MATVYCTLYTYLPLFYGFYISQLNQIFKISQWTRCCYDPHLQVRKEEELSNLFKVTELVRGGVIIRTQAVWLKHPSRLQQLLQLECK